MIALGRRRVALVAVLGLALLSGCSAPPPVEVVCEDCVDGVSAVTEETNRSVAVSESTTHLYLRESGGARVEAEVTLDGAGVDEFRANGTLLDLVRAKLTEGAPTRDEDRDERPAFDRRDLRVAMDGEDLVVTYRVAEMDARRIGGTVLFDRFYRQKGEGRLEASDPDDPARIETDRLVVHGPDGTEPLAEPPGATMHGDRLVWESDRISTRTYLLFGAPGTPDAVATVATTVDVLTWASPIAALGTAAAWAPLVVVLAGCLRYTGRVDPSDDWSPLSDRRFQMLVLVPVGTVVTWTALAFLGYALPSLVLLAALVVGVAYVSWESFTSSGDATGASTDAGAAPADARPEDVDVTGEYPKMFYEDTATTVKRVLPDVFATPRARHRTRVAGATAGVAMLLTLALAADHRGSYAETVAYPLGLVPLVAFAALGFGVVDRDRTRLRWVAVGASLVSAWVVAFGRAVAVGAHGSGGAWMVLFWGLAASYVGALLFYVALWTATR
ncbi:hypothetical protein ACFQMA_01680 [Halosimplex aquaticum]|uniref:Uncharacterized protein n=1 Tax=Halosimplex aquaticum TaxID=3026162 RepID=A0ABD5XTQ3_9EURY|nr:hypothetical protein [Halosimplex aquaticum]